MRLEGPSVIGLTIMPLSERFTRSKVRAVASSVPVGSRVSEPVFNSMQSSLRRGAVAFLVLLAAAARARVIASDFRLFAPDGLDHVVAARPRRLRSLGFAAIRG